MKLNNSTKIQLLVLAFVGLLVSGVTSRPTSESNDAVSTSEPVITDEDLKGEEVVLFKELCLDLISVSEWNLVRDSLKKFCLLLLVGNEMSADDSTRLNNMDQFTRPRRFLELGLGKSNDLTNTNSNKGFKYGK